MSSLPPPPPDPGGSWSSGWTPIPTSAPPAADLTTRPAWRQGHPGWALLHVAIATGLSLAGLFAIGIAVVVAGRSQTDIDLADETQTGLGTVALWVACLVGWFLFVYMRGSLQRRWIALGGIAGGGWLIALSLVLAATD